MREEDDLVDALGLELVLVLDVRGQVGSRAGGGESAGDGDDDDLLVGELCCAYSLVPDVALAAYMVGIRLVRWTYQQRRCSSGGYRRP